MPGKMSLKICPMSVRYDCKICAKIRVKFYHRFHLFRYWMCDIKPPTSGPLTGKKIGVKDCIAVAGVPMMCGSKVLEGFVPYDDATIIKRILNAGGEIAGKTTCEDMCLSCTSYCTTYGPVKNPLDPSRVTGGSSSGSAAAVS